MALIEIDYHPTRRKLNAFGLTWLAFFAVLGGVLLKHGGSLQVAMLAWAAAVAVPAVGWIAPEFMRWVFVGMSWAAFPIGLVVSFLVIAVVYYVVLTPIGLAMRLMGHDPMACRFDKNAETYWCPRQQDENASSYFRQF